MSEELRERESVSCAMRFIIVVAGRGAGTEREGHCKAAPQV